LHLELVEDSKVNKLAGWSSGVIPSEHAIRGFHGATLAEEDYEPTGELLESDLGFQKADEHADRHLYQTDAKLGSVIEIIDQSERNVRTGKGTGHHSAFRAENEEEQRSIRKRLLDTGYHVTERKDRQYFKSVYFYESGGVLFEIATDDPGFAIDEPVEELGNQLKLPKWLEDRRDLIEADLPELN
jgi:glyoxalase family protein